MFRDRKAKSTEDSPAKVSKANGAAAASFSVNITDAQYQKLAKQIYQLCGINLGDSKKELLRARLAKRLRARGCSDVKEYLTLLEGDSSGQELINFLDSITTNKTDFFREPQHFEFLNNTVLNELPRLCNPGEGLRIWCAACSTGEEPYTLAMCLRENQAKWSGRGASILASDIATSVLQHAQRGVYANERLGPIPRPILTRYFQKGRNKWAGHVKVKPELAELITFTRINLMDEFRPPKPYHIIFCRNVMIYFDKPTQQMLVEKFRQILTPGGYLFVGHSESLTGIDHQLSFVRPAVYRREK